MPLPVSYSHFHFGISLLAAWVVAEMTLSVGPPARNPSTSAPWEWRNNSVTHQKHRNENAFSRARVATASRAKLHWAFRSLSEKRVPIWACPHLFPKRGTQVKSARNDKELSRGSTKSNPARTVCIVRRLLEGRARESSRLIHLHPLNDYHSCGFSSPGNSGLDNAFQWPRSDVGELKIQISSLEFECAQCVREQSRRFWTRQGFLFCHSPGSQFLPRLLRETLVRTHLIDFPFKVFAEIRPKYLPVHHALHPATKWEVFHIFRYPSIKNWA